ncbi:MAG: hypothetical protein AABX89_07165 [Candidatus Thermoplasmatota archaeon]
MRIVKKTLKGNLLGKTRVRDAASKRVREEATGAGPTEMPTRLKPRTQATLDALVRDDDVVVIPSSLKPVAGAPIPIGKPERQARLEAERQKMEVRTEALRQSPAPPAPASKSAKAKAAASAPVAAAPSTPAPTLEGDSLSLARAVLANALLRAFGEPGSELRTPRGTTFHIAKGRGEGVVRTQHLVTIPLPSGHVVSHEADLVVEMDAKATLVVDIVASHTAPEVVKARSFDALLLRRIERSFSVLVCVRSPGPGLAASQLEAIAHGYDLHFNVDAADVHLESKFAALRSRIAAWVDAVAKGA